MSARADVAITSFSYTNLSGAYDDTSNVFSATGISNSTGDMNRIVAPTGQAHFNAGALTEDVIFDMNITNVTGFNVGDTAEGEGTFTFRDTDTTEITGSIQGTWTLNMKVSAGGGNFITAYTFFGLLSDININNDNDTYDGSTGSWSTDFSGIATEPYHGYLVTLALNFADVGSGWFERGDYSGADVNTIGSIRGDEPQSDECLTRTIGFWGTHQHITDLFLPVTVCGDETLSVTDAGTCDLATEALCVSPGRESRKNRAYAILVRQLTAAKLNIAATATNGGFCGGGIETRIFECEQLCNANHREIGASGCIDDLTAFNESLDTFPMPPVPFDSPGPADPTECRSANGNGIVIGKGACD